MAARGDKVSVDLDAEIVERTRSALGSGGESDAAVVELRAARRERGAA